MIRESVRAVAQELMNVEVSELIGAELGERTEDRATHRNGYRPRRWDTRAGEIELEIPKIRQGSYFPSFLQPRKRSSRRWSRWCSRRTCVASRRGALISSWRVWGCGSQSRRSAGSRGSWMSRSRRSGSALWRAATPNLLLDAKVEKVRDGGRIARKCVVVAHAAHESGRREIIGLDVGEAETEALWREFLRSLVARGLVGVQLAISDAHPGRKAARMVPHARPSRRGLGIVVVHGDAHRLCERLLHTSAVGGAFHSRYARWEQVLLRPGQPSPIAAGFPRRRRRCRLARPRRSRCARRGGSAGNDLAKLARRGQ